MRFGFHTEYSGARGDRHGHGRRAMRGGFDRGLGRTNDFEEGRGPRRRMLDGGELRLVLLRLIGDQPRHGYDLIRAIEERTGGVYAPSPGGVYPTLTMLRDMEQIVEQAPDGADSGNRKLFAVTPEGERVLAVKSDETAAVMERLDAIGRFRERAEGATIRHAVRNLKVVLRNRLGGESVAAGLLHEVVALIDDAARKIERL